MGSVVPLKYYVYTIQLFLNIFSPVIKHKKEYQVDKRPWDLWWPSCVLKQADKFTWRGFLLFPQKTIKNK